MVWVIMIIVLFAGCVGGLIGGILAGEKAILEEGKPQLSHKGDKCETWFATLLGNILIGGVAAVVFWGLYGPLSVYPIVGSTDLSPSLSIGDLAGSIVVGISGAGFLRLESSRRCVEDQLKKK